MPVRKFKSVEEMPRIVRVEGAGLVDRIRTLWNRAFLMSPPNFPRGVTRFASIEEANAARDKATAERMRRLSATHSEVENTEAPADK